MVLKMVEVLEGVEIIYLWKWRPIAPPRMNFRRRRLKIPLFRKLSRWRRECVLPIPEWTSSPLRSSKFQLFLEPYKVHSYNHALKHNEQNPGTWKGQWKRTSTSLTDAGVWWSVVVVTPQSRNFVHCIGDDLWISHTSHILAWCTPNSVWEAMKANSIWFLWTAWDIYRHTQVCFGNGGVSQWLNLGILLWETNKRSRKEVLSAPALFSKCIENAEPGAIARKTHNYLT